VQTSLVQSAATLQARDGPHIGHVVPPQSTSVSVPSSTTSVHMTFWHRASLQNAIVQSVASLQMPPTPHFGHVVPPQSTSVSSPLVTPSVHDGPASTPTSLPPLPPDGTPPAPLRPPFDVLPPAPVSPPVPLSPPESGCAAPAPLSGVGRAPPMPASGPCADALPPVP
jgi:hypothetical protein